MGLILQGWEDDHDEAETPYSGAGGSQGPRRASGCSPRGSDLAEVLRHLEITESTWHRWRRAYAGMSASDARRLKELESENARLKKLLAEAELDKAMLKELAGKW